ncbi:MAG: phytanoyl-CoA dioxygenase family protein [Ilumatobacteraceae bacterium]
MSNDVRTGAAANSRIDPSTVSVDGLRAAVELPMSRPALAADIRSGVPVYDAAALRQHIAASGPLALLDEWADVLAHGAGIFVVSGAVDADVLHPVTAAFTRMIDEQNAAGSAQGDHFAKPGTNDRVWNAFEKLAVAEPAAFVRYYANDMLALGCRAWLGPGYQVSSQVNRVNPGGQAQMPHRDYHLGFMTDERAAEYPLHVHHLSPALTLQGAIAHCDMPVESGPTIYLPGSQRYPLGYLAWRHPDVIAYFDAEHVQLALAEGDMVWFNPALLHAAGSNRTADILRMANLLQVSSSMGRTMETIDTRRIAEAIYPALLEAADTLDADSLEHVLTAATECYAFPTNLDRDPPVGGLTPPTQRDLVGDALARRATPAELAGILDAHDWRRASH